MRAVSGGRRGAGVPGSLRDAGGRRVPGSGGGGAARQAGL